MLENPDFEQDSYSRTATGLFRNGHDRVRLTKWLVHYDRSLFVSINYCDLMSSFLICVKDGKSFQ